MPVLLLRILPYIMHKILRYKLLCLSTPLVTLLGEHSGYYSAKAIYVCISFVFGVRFNCT
jgi:hypothetical protein